MNKFQKFLRVADGCEKTDFLLWQFFWLQQYFNLFSDLMDRKMARAKKVVIIKNLFFFIDVNHVKEFFKSIHTSVVFLQFSARASNGPHPSYVENLCYRLIWGLIAVNKLSGLCYFIAANPYSFSNFLPYVGIFVPFFQPNSRILVKILINLGLFLIIPLHFFPI